MATDTKIDDGGPAFPFPSGPEPRVNEFHDRCEGMSLRDYFAGCALQSYMASPTALRQLDEAITKEYTGNQDRRWVFNRVLANRAYRLADAMITARSTPQPDQSIELGVVSEAAP